MSSFNVRAALSRCCSRRRYSLVTVQNGSALIALLALLVTIFGAFFYHLLNARPQYLAGHTGTVQHMALAIDGLIAYSGQKDSMGLLPCPDLDFPADGRANEPCSQMPGQLLGWLPWQTLGLEPLRDDAGNLLMYAVAAGYVRGKGDADKKIFKLKNSAVAQAAMVIAPGMALPGQRRSPEMFQVAQWTHEWLEGDNRTAVQQTTEGVFEQREESLAFNDRLLPLPAALLVGNAIDKKKSY